MPDVSVLIRDLPLEVNRMLNALALVRGINKWEVTREALIEYAKRHHSELAKLTK